MKKGSPKQIDHHCDHHIAIQICKGHRKMFPSACIFLTLHISWIPQARVIFTDTSRLQLAANQWLTTSASPALGLCLQMPKTWAFHIKVRSFEADRHWWSSDKTSGPHSTGHLQGSMYCNLRVRPELPHLGCEDYFSTRNDRFWRGRWKKW